MTSARKPRTSSRRAPARVSARTARESPEPERHPGPGKVVEPPPRSGKVPFDIDEVLGRIRESVKHFADAAMFALAARGHDSLFEQLVACILSIRTRDEVSLPVSLALLERASTPDALARMTPEAIDEIIHPVTFHEAKAYQLRAMPSGRGTSSAGSCPAMRRCSSPSRAWGPSARTWRSESPAGTRPSAWTSTCTG